MYICNIYIYIFKYKYLISNCSQKELHVSRYHPEFHTLRQSSGIFFLVSLKRNIKYLSMKTKIIQ